MSSILPNTYIAASKSGQAFPAMHRQEANGRIDALIMGAALQSAQNCVDMPGQTGWFALCSGHEKVGFTP